MMMPPAVTRAWPMRMRPLLALLGCLALAGCGLAGTAAGTAAGAASEAQQASQARQTEDKVRAQIKDAAAVDAAQRERAEKDAQ